MPETKEEITDSERLVFMLDKYRVVVTEVVGSNGRGDTFYEVYVEEGFMANRRYPAVKVVGNINTAMNLASKRESIDLAINEVRSETSEKSNQ